MRCRLGMALCLLACAGSPAPPPLGAITAPDDAVQLAAWLPDRAHRCVVLRPGRVPARRRALLFRQSWSDPNAWEPDLRVTAYARAEATLSDGRRALRSFFRFSGTAEQARARALAMRVRWDDDPCRGISCRRPVARWLDERTLEVSRHEWPPGVRGLSTGACVRLARARTQAVEVAIQARPLERRAPTAERLERVLTTDTRGLTIHSRLPFPHARDAEAAAFAIRESAPVWESPQPLDTTERRVEVRAARLHLIDTYTWTDLELAREDERLAIAAREHRRRRAEALPLAEVDVSRLAAVRHQLRLRERALGRLRGDVRRQRAAALAALLERAYAAHPGELWLAERLVRVQLDETGEPGAARALAETVLRDDLARDPEVWRALRREAVAAEGPEALGAALEADGLLTGRNDARRAAEDLVSLARDGVAFEWAEGALRLGRELTEPEVSHRAAGALARRGVIGALVGLARLSHPDAGGGLEVAVVTSADHPAHAVGSAGPELIVTRAADRGSVVVAASDSHDLLEVRRLAGLIDPLIGAGPVTYAVQLREPGAATGARARLQGTVRGEEVFVRRVSRDLAAIRLADVQRFLARPLHDLAPALFPPPELIIRARSPEAAEALWGHAARIVPDACAQAGPLLRCRAPGRSHALSELLLALSRRRVQGLLQRAHD